MVVGGDNTDGCALQDWLAQLSEEMKVTLQQNLTQCLAEGRSESGMDPLNSPSQVWCALLDAF